MAELREFLSDNSLVKIGYERIQKESSDMGTRMSVRVGRRNYVGTIVGVPGEDFGIAEHKGKTTLLTTQCFKVKLLGSGKIVLVRPPKVEKDEEDS